VGVSAESVSGADGSRVKVAGHLTENTASKLIEVIPPLSADKRKAAVKTRFVSGGPLLKDPCIIECRGELAVSAAGQYATVPVRN
jgi:hypothetical protein